MNGSTSENNRSLLQYFEYIDSKYPNKILVNFSKDKYIYKKGLYFKKILGYDNVGEFLRAYGYITKRKVDRPYDLTLIDELNRRYPGGRKFNSINELVRENQDLSGKIGNYKRTVKKISPSLTLYTYLKNEGFIK